MAFRFSYEPLENAAMYPDQQLFTQMKGNEQILFVSTKLQSTTGFQSK